MASELTLSSLPGAHDAENVFTLLPDTNWKFVAKAAVWPPNNPADKPD